jgi:LDH2 family malate/lactate/ureidoglycolate dehydrogenase
MPELTRDRLEPLVTRALERWGATPAVARCVAEHLVESDLSGHPSHGVRQLPGYREMIASGECDMGAEPEVTGRTGAVTRIDGRSGMGQPAMALAVSVASDSAAELGVGLAAIVRCGHTGRMGAWAERAASRGMASVMFTAWGEPPFTVALGPGSRPAFHTNPLAIGVPAERDHLVLDMATSAIAEGKVAVAAESGTPLPAGAALDAAGRPTRDAAAVLAGGALLPAGGYKGFGLAAMIEALAIGVVGADGPGMEPASGALVICIRADLFRSSDEQTASVEALRARLHASGQELEVLAPGELEQRARAAPDRVEVDEDVLALLEAPG